MCTSKSTGCFYQSAGSLPSKAAWMKSFCGNYTWISQVQPPLCKRLFSVSKLKLKNEVGNNKVVWSGKWLLLFFLYCEMHKQNFLSSQKILKIYVDISTQCPPQSWKLCTSPTASIMDAVGISNSPQNFLQSSIITVTPNPEQRNTGSHFCATILPITQ